MGFGRLQIAYETLSDPCKRAVYDDFAKDLQYRYVEGWTHKVGVVVLHSFASGFRRFFVVFLAALGLPGRLTRYFAYCDG